MTEEKKLAPFYGVVTTLRGEGTDDEKTVRTSRTGEGFMRVEACDDTTTYRLEIDGDKVTLERSKMLWGPSQGEFIDWEELHVIKR